MLHRKRSVREGFLKKLEGPFAGFVLIILSGLLRIRGLRSEICRLVPLDYVDYLTATTERAPVGPRLVVPTTH